MEKKTAIQILAAAGIEVIDGKLRKAQAAQAAMVLAAPTEKQIMAADCYSFNVTFTRNVQDDMDVAKSQFPGVSDPVELLLKQLQTELQEAYDAADIAGQFNIDKSSFKLED